MCKSKQFTCKLCNQATDERIQYFRGLDLCGTCERCLVGGDYSAKIIADEIKAMRRGTLAIDRAPLPAGVRYFFEPFLRPAYDHRAAEIRAEWRQAERMEVAKAGLACLRVEREAAVSGLDPAAPAAGPTLAALTAPLVSPEPAKVRSFRKPRRTRPARKLTARKVQLASQHARDWRENARRLSLAIHV